VSEPTPRHEPSEPLPYDPTATPPAPAEYSSGPTALSLRAPVGGYSGVYFGKAPAAQPEIAASVAAPARTSHRRLWITVALLSVIALVGGAAAAIWVWPVYAERNTTVSAPIRVAGMNVVDDPELKQLINRINDQVRAQTGVSDTVAAFYGPVGDKAHGALAIAGASWDMWPWSDKPQKNAAAAFGSLPGGGLYVSDVQAYPSARRGTVQCGTTTAAGVPISVCVWADHGSFGMVLFYNRSVNDSAVLVLKVRDDMVQRG